MLFRSVSQSRYAGVASLGLLNCSTVFFAVKRLLGGWVTGSNVFRIRFRSSGGVDINCSIGGIVGGDGGDGRGGADGFFSIPSSIGIGSLMTIFWRLGLRIGTLSSSCGLIG